MMKFCDKISIFSGSRLFCNGLRVRKTGGLGLRKGTQWSSAYVVEMHGEFLKAGSQDWASTCRAPQFTVTYARTLQLKEQEERNQMVVSLQLFWQHWTVIDRGARSQQDFSRENWEEWRGTERPWRQSRDTGVGARKAVVRKGLVLRFWGLSSSKWKPYSKYSTAGKDRSKESIY